MDFYLHNINDDDIAEVVKVLKSPILTTGKVTSEFEKKLADYLKIPHVVTLNSCTAALHLALLAFDIGESDEVITTPMSFCATANAILHTGAKPVFVDIDFETGNIEPENIEKAITSKTKAIIPVHLYGVLCDMKKIYNIAKKYNLKIISDCAHSLESTRDGYNSTEYCDAACYSFYATKNLSCGEGGAVACKDEKLSDRIKVLRLHGMSKSAIDRYTSGYKHYDILEIGWKYNLDDIHSAMMIKQIERIDSILCDRKKLYDKFLNALSGLKAISIPKIPENCKSAHHLFTINVNDSSKRDEAIKKFQESDIPVAVNFNSIHLMSVYRKVFGFKEGDFPKSEKFGASTITLPFYTKLTDSDFNRIIEVCRYLFA